MSEKPLSPQEREFVLWYVVLRDGAAAARKAGYKDHSAKKIAYAALQRPRVRKAVEEAQAEIDARLEAERGKVVAAVADAVEQELVTREYVIGILKENVERSMQAVPVLDHEGKPTGEYQYDGKVVNGAARMLGESIGMFKQVVDSRTRGKMVVQVVYAREGKAK